MSTHPQSAPPHSNGPPHRVVVTGVGPLTGAGLGVEGLWNGLRQERSPIGPVTRFDSTLWRCRIACEIADFDARDFMESADARRLDRFTQFAVAASTLSLRDAGLDPAGVDGDRVAVQMGSALGGVAHAEEQVVRLGTGGVRSVDPRVALTTFCGAASCTVAIAFGFTGANSTNAMSCASGTIAIGEAWRLIRDGSADIALAGGVEAPLAPLSFGAFAIIRAMSTRNDAPGRACRPFDRGRDGFVMGEGACVLTLERLDLALARGARIYAEIAGYGTTNDAHHMAAPRPDGRQAARAMGLALASAAVEPEAVDLVSAHGSSTPLNDATETIAIKRVLGDHAYRVPVSATKPYHGHALGASGAIEAGILCLSFQRGWVPPTLNFEEGGKGCDLDYIPNRGRELRPTIALSNSFGFGGINAALVLKRHDPA